MTTRRTRLFAAALSLLCALLALLFATSSSPLYATNFWTDTNIYFTIGRGMTRGLMPYRDLFDHKGPLLFILYALGALVSDASFAGVFLLQVLSLACTLFIGWRIVCLYGEGRLTLAAIPLTAIVSVTCTAYTQGGSAEEFCLPALALGLLCALLRMREGSACSRAGRLCALLGAATGWVFSIKYTDCGLFFGLAFLLLCWEARACSLPRAVRSALCMAAGFAAILLPQALYLAANGALGDCVSVYFIQNIFDYGGEPMSLTGHVYNALAYLRTQSAANPAVAGLAMLGCAWTFGEAAWRRQRGFLFETLAAPVAAGLLLLFAYWGEMAHPYYALVFAALVPLGLAPLGALARVVDRLPANALSGRSRPSAGRVAFIAACAPALVLTLAVAPACRALCAAVPLMDVRREDMAQTVFAQIINEEENPTLLDLCSLDQGFYLAAGVTPNVRYFADNNLNTEEKRAAIEGYLANGAAQFVVAVYREIGEGYELIAEHSSPFDLNDMRPYKLYRRIDSLE